MTASPEDMAREIIDIVPILMRSIRAEMRNQRSTDLTVTQFRALLFIRRNQHTSLKNLSHHLGLTPPTVCKMVDAMVLDQLVRRETSPDDRRMITLALTEKGNDILEKARSGTQERLAKVLSQLSPQDGEIVMKAMSLLHPLFSHHAEGETPGLDLEEANPPGKSHTG
jgi:DNA-binding MarR family transcriptional regulator